MPVHTEKREREIALSNTCKLKPGATTVDMIGGEYESPLDTCFFS